MAGLKAEYPLGHLHTNAAWLLEHVLAGELGYAFA